MAIDKLWPYNTNPIVDIRGRTRNWDDSLNIFEDSQIGGYKSTFETYLLGGVLQQGIVAYITMVSLDPLWVSLAVFGVANPVRFTLLGFEHEQFTGGCMAQQGIVKWALCSDFRCSDLRTVFHHSSRLPHSSVKKFPAPLLRHLELSYLV